MSDKGYREPDMPESERIERLEQAVAKFSLRRFYETIKFGTNTLLIGVACVLVAYGAQQIAEGVHARERLTNETHQSSRDQCATACASIHLGVERARVSSENPARLSQCTCRSPGRRQVLWDDTQQFRAPSRDEQLRAQCATACETAGMGLNRAVLSGYGDSRTVIACGCINEHSHRTLWDDRPHSHPARAGKETEQR